MNLVPRRARPDGPAHPARPGPAVGGLLLAGLTALGVAAAPAAAAATVPEARAVTVPEVDASAQPTCAWPRTVSADTLNVFLPDTAATYWVLPYEVQDDLEIVVSGQYADARYMSLTTYDGARGTFESNGVGSGLADHRIAPDQGSANPWQQAVPPGGRFTVTARMDVAPDQTNVLPLAPPGTAEGSQASLILRVYLPAGGDPSSVVLPAVTLRQGGTSQTLPPCSPAGRVDGGDAAGAGAGADVVPAIGAREDTGAARSAPPEPGTLTEPLEFARPSEANAVFANLDNAYLAGWVAPPAADEVIVVRGKAPRAATGEHPAPWPGPQDDVRYWSMCTNLEFPLLPVVVNRLPGGEVHYGCRHDAATALDDSGSYTYVIGTERQRAAAERVPGVTFLPFSLTQPRARHLVLLRNMMPVAGFAHAVQRVPQDDLPASAAAVMGPYYPRTSVCALTTLVSAGPAGCAPADG